LPHVSFIPTSPYEGSIGIVTRKIIFLLLFIVLLGLFMAKKHDLSDKQKFRLSRAVAGGTQNLGYAYNLPLKS
jgi:hypothetical protein